MTLAESSLGVFSASSLTVHPDSVNSSTDLAFEDPAAMRNALGSLATCQQCAQFLKEISNLY